MTYKTILQEYGDSLPHRFLVKYAVSCAKSCSHLTSKKSQAALAVAERYGNEEDVSEKERKEAWDDAYAAAYAASAAYAHAAVSYATSATSSATFSASTPSSTSASAATSASYAEEAIPGFNATALLVNMLKEEFTEFDRIMMRN